MRLYTVIEKPIGVTPLEAMEAFRENERLPLDLPLTYAGRLDPMASGKLLVLMGEECKRQERYRGLDKEYVIEVVLDLSTDTGDTLGLPRTEATVTTPPVSEIRKALHAVLGTHSVPYPAFSSKTINGKPLFQYSLEGTLSSITIPEHEETVHSLVLTDVKTVSSQDLERRISEQLSVVPRPEGDSFKLGDDFRQDAIRHAWRELLTENPDRSYVILSLKVTCASGTYMRTLASRIAKEFQTTGFALSIHRTKIGKYRKVFGSGVWIKVLT